MSGSRAGAGVSSWVRAVRDVGGAGGEQTYRAAVDYKVKWTTAIVWLHGPNYRVIFMYGPKVIAYCSKNMSARDFLSHLGAHQMWSIC